MLAALPFLKLAMISLERQRVFRRLVVFHVLFIALLAGAHATLSWLPLANLSHALLIAAIIEGAILIGWRLAQLPKSQALEFLLVSPLQPRWVLLGEAFAGLGRLALVTLAGVPPLLLLVFAGVLEMPDLGVLTVVPFLWGAIGGIGLTAWAYEARIVRRWGERVMIVLVLVYLIVGVLAAERLSNWLTVLPGEAGEVVYRMVLFCSRYNPFGLLEYWLAPARDAALAWDRVALVAVGSTGLLVVLTARAAARLRGHFQDRHYRPMTNQRRSDVASIGDRPLAWWAVRRVMEYSGRLNIWLAGGFGVVYAAFILLGDAWPPWMGKMVFHIFEGLGGVPAVTTGLVVLAAVPAAFQYGLWDPSAQDRSRRLELLLLTDLDGDDYWGAALRAAWKRGRGYFVVAGILWTAFGFAGRASWLQLVLAGLAALNLWAFCFAVGFRAFSRGLHANGLGTLLTLGLPLLTGGLLALGLPMLAPLIPPGAVYSSLTRAPSLLWLPGPLLTLATTVWLAKSSRRRCVDELRAWVGSAR